MHSRCGEAGAWNFQSRFMTKKGPGVCRTSGLLKVVAYNIRVFTREVEMMDFAINLAEEALALDDCICQKVDMRS